MVTGKIYITKNNHDIIVDKKQTNPVDSRMVINRNYIEKSSSKQPQETYNFPIPHKIDIIVKTVEVNENDVFISISKIYFNTCHTNQICENTE